MKTNRNYRIVADLQRAKERIEDPTRWCKGAYQTDDDRRCAVGALFSPTGRLMPKLDFLQRASMDLYGLRAWYVNDKLGHAAVMEMYDRAIQMAWEEGRR